MVPAKNSPTMPCDAGQAGSTGDRLAEYDASHSGNIFDHVQTRVGSRATWVDDTGLPSVSL